jgi:hypothetical protein
MDNVQRQGTSMSRASKVRWLALLLGLVLLIVTAEVFAYVFLTLDITAIRSRVYLPPQVSGAAFAEYLAIRDPVLGWPGTVSAQLHLDALGARRAPANAAFADQLPCVSLYGDSHTYSHEVDDADAWGNVLTGLLRCPVLNFGMSGFGVDQAVLRFVGNTHDNASVTLLVVSPSDLVRNMNQWRFLLTGREVFGFKPTYDFAQSDEPQVVPLPVSDYATFEQMLKQPHLLLKNESFLPDRSGMRSPIRLRSPYSWSLFRFAGKLVHEVDWGSVSFRRRVRDWFYPEWYETQEGLEPSTLRRYALIVREFAGSCRSRGRQCAVVLLPTVDILREDRRSAVTAMKRLYESSDREIETWDLTTKMRTVMSGADICHYFGKNEDCVGHANARGYRVIAEAVAARLTGVDPAACKSAGRVCVSSAPAPRSFQ